MARGRQTEVAVLGALSVRPMTGYAVRQSIQEVLGHFWSESFGQIYPTLATLRDEGLVRTVEGDRAGSSVYHLTPAGRARLLELLSQPDQPSPPRNGVLLRLFFGAVLGPEECRALVTRARAEAEQRLSTFAGLRAEMEQEPELADQQPYWLLTVSAGEHGARATIAWADETIAALDTLIDARPAGEDRRRSR